MKRGLREAPWQADSPVATVWTSIVATPIKGTNMKPLTARQEDFVREFLLDLNATQAAIRAGYSASTAYSQGQRLLKNVEVQAAIAKARAAAQDRAR